MTSGNEGQHETLPAANPPSFSLTVAPATGDRSHKGEFVVSPEPSVSSLFCSVSPLAAPVPFSPNPSQLNKRRSRPAETPTHIPSSTGTTGSATAVTPPHGSTRMISRTHATSYDASRPCHGSPARLSHSVIPRSQEASAGSPCPAQTPKGSSGHQQASTNSFRLLKGLESLSHLSQTTETQSRQASAAMPSTKLFGRYTQRTVVRRNLLPATHAILRRIEVECPGGDWSDSIRTLIPDISAEVADELAEAMHRDAGIFSGP